MLFLNVRNQLFQEKTYMEKELAHLNLKKKEKKGKKEEPLFAESDDPKDEDYLPESASDDDFQRPKIKEIPPTGTKNYHFTW